FRKLLEEQLIDHYDFIFIDVPPTLGLSNDTAFYACDQIIIVLQTQERSLVGAEYLLEYLQRVIINSFQSKVD
ncbi:AAA family ATPase, partial [Bifidobacterium longum]|nr:AAA family ATPase [Bifidobacterium longum]